MAIKSTYIVAIAAIVVVAAGVGGYMYYQNMQKEALKQERYQRWVEWSRTLYVGTTSATLHPDIQVGYGGVDRGVIHLQSAKLLYPDFTEMGEFQPYIADSWEMKKNAAGEWYIEYKLKQGLTFHDGEELTSEAVKYSWEREAWDLFNRTVAQETHHKWWHETSWKRLETPDDLTFWQFMPDEAPTYLPHPLAAMHLTQHSFLVGPESTEMYCKENDPVDLAVKQAGIGPFKLVEWLSDERVVLEAWEDMFENLIPHQPTKAKGIDKVVFIIYDDATTLRMALEKGEIDVVHNTLRRADVGDLQENPDIVVEITKGVGYTRHLEFNVRPEFYPLNDTRVRKAMAYAIFPDEIIEKCLFGIGTRADSQEAKELLAEAGFPDGFKADFWFSAGGSAEEYRDMATVLQAQLKKIGIELELKQIESGVFTDLRNSGKIPMSFQNWCPDYADPDTDLFYCLHPESRYLPLYTGYNNTEIGRLIDLGKQLYDPAGDPPEREQVYIEIQKIAADEVPGVWLFHDDIWNAYRSWVKDFSFFPYTYMCPAWDARKEIPSNWETTEPPR